MKNLILMRHGKSSWSDEDLNDFQRPLKKRGQRDVPIMAHLLMDEGLTPDLILASPATRSRETAELAAEAFGTPPDHVRYVDNFYMADIQDFYEALTELEDDYDTVMLVGHNPSLEMLMQSLTGDIDMLPTAAVAHIGLNIQLWSDLTDEDTHGVLRGVWRPKELDL